MEELLALRDGEGSAFARSHADSCHVCRAELDRLYQVRAELRALPRYTPPRELWPKVADEVRQRRLRRRLSYRMIVLAAAAVLAGVAILRGPAREESGPTDVWLIEETSRDLGPVIARSQELEGLLRAFRPEYRVYDAPTALAVSALEDRIVLLDRMLLEGRAIGLEREVLVGLWGERVEALETLVGLQATERPERVWR
jgi:hypothetical protein